MEVGLDVLKEAGQEDSRNGHTSVTIARVLAVVEPSDERPESDIDRSRKRTSVYPVQLIGLRIVKGNEVIAGVVFSKGRLQRGVRWKDEQPD